MEVSGVRPRRSREASPDRARVYMQPKARAFRKVQVIYYLCRNGQLEHPHFMEVSHLPSHHLRLKDVMDRLTVLRGRGMPSLFSWSCKRSYKSGYVWNDLAENDVIHPAEGAEYVLKGSEIIEGSAERFQQLQLGTHRRKPLPVTQPRHLEVEEEEEEEIEEQEVEEEEEIEEDKANHHRLHHNHNLNNNNNAGCYHTPFSRCSCGVSTEEIPGPTKTHHHHHSTELALDEDASPPSTSSSSDKAQANANITPTTPAAPAARNTRRNGGGSNRFENSDSVDEPGQTRNSVLLQLIACGSNAVRGRSGLLKSAPSDPPPPPPPPPSSNTGGTSGRKSSVSLHKGIVCRVANKAAMEEDEINYMSENPRFGNPQLEDKEYFSGSIVESITENGRATAASEPSLKKSSSYNEERSTKCGGIGEGLMEVMGEERSIRGKCLPTRRRSSACKQQHQIQIQQQSKK